MKKIKNISDLKIGNVYQIDNFKSKNNLDRSIYSIFKVVTKCISISSTGQKYVLSDIFSIVGDKLNKWEIYPTDENKINIYEISEKEYPEYYI